MQFGDPVAIHYYGASEAEKAELEAAAHQDEEEEQIRRHSLGGEKRADVHHEEHAELKA